MSHLQLTPERSPDDAADGPAQDRDEQAQGQDEAGPSGARLLVEPRSAAPRDRSEDAREPRPEHPDDSRPADDEVRRAAVERLDRLQVERAADEGMTGATAPAATGYDSDHGDDDEGAG